MITDLTKVFKLKRVPKITINPDDEKATQLNKFWTYLYKSAELEYTVELEEELYEAIKYFYGSVKYAYTYRNNYDTARFVGRCEDIIDGNVDAPYGVRTASGGYVIRGLKTEPVFYNVKYGEQYKDYPAHVYIVGNDGIFNRYDKQMVYLDYGSIVDDGCKFATKKTRTTAFLYGTDLVYNGGKDVFVVNVVDAKALWVLWKFKGLFEEANKKVEYDFEKRAGYVYVGSLGLTLSLASIEGILKVFTGINSNKDKMIIRLHPVYGYVLDLLHALYSDQILRKYQLEYEKSLLVTQAAVFQTKKHITKEKLRLMNTSPLLDRFSFVEIDNDIDNDTYLFIEECINKFPFVLPRGIIELRFRKLGNYKANGLWFPALNNLCVDIRNVTSFVHEYGHAIDYLYTGNLLSMSDDFAKIRTLVYNEFIRSGIKDLEYYGSPTEIFARCFEVYVYTQGYCSSLLGEYENKDDAFKTIYNIENMITRITEYFDKMFKGVFVDKSITQDDVVVAICHGDCAIALSSDSSYQEFDARVVHGFSYKVKDVSEDFYSKILGILNNGELTSDDKALIILEGIRGVFSRD